MKRAVGLGLVVASAWCAARTGRHVLHAQPVPDPGSGSQPVTESADPGPKATAVPAHPPGTGSDGKIILSTCNDFDVLTPLYGLSNRNPDRGNPNHRDSLRVTGPVASGIGAGYYHTLTANTCKKDWSIDWEVFGFSEGLDPASTFQLGVGGGLALTVFGKFQFGIALGYDLIRVEHIETGGVKRSYSNGLLEWNDVLGCGTSRGGPDAYRCAGRNFTWLLTFGLTAGSSSESATTTAGSPGAGSGSG
jgi:hypothetical protein